MDLEELQIWLNKNPEYKKVYQKLQDAKEERNKLKAKCNALGRKNSDIGYKKWTEKRSMSTGKEQTELLLNATEQEPMKKRIKELDKMIKLMSEYKEPSQLKLFEKMSTRDLNLKYRRFEESLLEKQKVLGTIIQDKDGYNILDDKKEKMLLHSYPSLKKMLQDIVANL